MLSPGGLSHLSEEDLVSYYRAGCKSTSCYGFYLQTSVGGRIFTYDYWQKVCSIENLIGIKCASFDRYTTLDVVRAAALSPSKKEIFYINEAMMTI